MLGQLKSSSEIAKGYLPLFPIDSDAVEASSDRNLINASSHVAKAGDLIVFTSGQNQGLQIPVISVETNAIHLAGFSNVKPTTGDTFLIFRPALPKRVYKNVAAAATDSMLIAGVTGKVLRVLGLFIITGATSTTLVFNTATGAGVGTAISCNMASVAGTPMLLPESCCGWFETIAGDRLTITTGAGSATGFQIIYVEL